MRNPLRKRLPRDLKSDFSKYFVIFILLAGTIAMISGFVVAANSMIIAYNESFEKYNIENGNFRTVKELTSAKRTSIEEEGNITIYDNYYIEDDLTNESTMRFFQMRKEVNLADLMSGEFPSKEGEVAIDRMYAKNRGILIGDSISDGEREWQVTGLVALSDYSALFRDNNDIMFDASNFGVAVVTPEAFSLLDQDQIAFNYAWKYEEEPEDEVTEKELSDDLKEIICDHTVIESFVPRYLNQAIQFTGEDLGSDSVMMVVLLYILIVIIAFVFAVIVNNTIAKEACVIGTLRASGYTKNEIIFHYMTMPVLISLLAAIVGNILGYTWLKQVAANLYYGSYSLPSYTTVWSATAFVQTTIVPMILLVVIDYAVLWKKMRLSPLRFLRRDLASKKQKKAFPLSDRIPFFNRFRMRVVLQNKGNYVVMFFGIFFAYFLLFFGMAFPNMLVNYQENIENNMICNYTYLLSIPEEMQRAETKLDELLTSLQFMRAVETDNEDAEKFSAHSLETPESTKYINDSVILYGIEDDSRYINLDVSDNQVYITTCYAEKYLVEPGDEITLLEKYEDKSYTFTVSGIYDYDGAVAIYMGRDYLNQIFDQDKDFFAGYFSDSEITDIDSKYFGSVIDITTLTKLSRQLTISMGGMMKGVQLFALIMFMVLIYLLSKIIIEKNAQSISMSKILGYSNMEIGKLYVMSTSLVVVGCILLSFPLLYYSMIPLIKVMLRTMMSGWLRVELSASLFPKMFVMGVLTYMVVAVIEYGKIKKVAMDEALKNVE